jgi:hypothetical protein
MNANNGLPKYSRQLQYWPPQVLSLEIGYTILYIMYIDLIV